MTGDELQFVVFRLGGQEFALGIAEKHERHAEQRARDGNISQFPRLRHDKPVTGQLGDGCPHFGARWSEQSIGGNQLRRVFAQILGFGCHKAKSSSFSRTWQVPKFPLHLERNHDILRDTGPAVYTD